MLRVGLVHFDGAISRHEARCGIGILIASLTIDTPQLGILFIVREGVPYETVARGFPANVRAYVDSLTVDFASIGLVALD